MTDLTDQISDRPPPGWPKVVGILSIVFGVIALTCTVGGVGLLIASNSILPGMMGGQLPDGVPPPPMAPALDALMIASWAVGFVVNIILIAAGMALLRRKASGRSMHLVYALLAVISGFFGSFVGYQSGVKQEQALQTWIEQHGGTELGQQLKKQQNQQAGMQQTIRIGFTALGLGTALAWPGFCIIWFGMVKRDADSMLGAVDEFV